MYSKVLKIFILICTLVLCFGGCQNNEKTVISNEQEVLSIYKTEISLKDELDPTWNIEIQKQLELDYGLNELQRERQNKSANFELFKIKYNGVVEYNEYIYPYTMESNLIIWKSNDFYAICKIKSNEITGTKQNPIIDKDEPDKKMWNEDVKLLKVLPINEATLYTIGGRATFANTNKEKVGPFTLVESFYFACP